MTDLDLTGLLVGVGPVRMAGSYVSGLMSWPDLDVMVHVGPRFTPADVVRLLERIAERPDVVGFDYRDERANRSPTGTVRDERYHLVVLVSTPLREWRVDLTLWLHDDHANVTAFHESLRRTITTDQRDAVLRIKDVWHRALGYPDEFSGIEIYKAVLEDGIRTAEEFGRWLQHPWPPRPKLSRG